MRNKDNNQGQNNPENRDSMLNRSATKGLKAIHSTIAKTKGGMKPRQDQAASNVSYNKLGLDLDSPRLSNGMETSRDNTDIGIGAGMGGVGQHSKGFKLMKDFSAGMARTLDPLRNNLNRAKCKPGYQIFEMNAHEPEDVGLKDYPETALDSTDYAKRLRFEELKKIKLEEMCSWKLKDIKGIKKNAYIKEIQKRNDQILSVTDKDDLEKLEVMTDRFPLLKLRKSIYRSFILLNMVCNTIIETKVFDNFTTMVILANCGTMIANQPLDQNPPQFFADAESVFLVLYTGEMVLKILGLGFILGKTAYLKDSWNILDFVIVVTSLMSVGGADPATATEEESAFNVSGFRAFRVMRPLRTISSIKGLKVLMSALIAAIPLLGDTLTILFGFFLTFAIAGQQLFSGILKLRCFNVQTGRELPDLSLCASDADCPGGFYCGKGNVNPNNGATNFDNVPYSFLAVFQTTTLEGWSDVQVQVEQCFSELAVIYFTLIVFGGAFFMLNLTLAVINSKFTEAHNAHQNQTAQGDDGLGAGENKTGDNELDQALQQKDEMSIAQFITARIYAKKMIEFLRMRQEIKRIEHERMLRIKEKQKIQDEAKRNVVTTTQKPTNNGAKVQPAGQPMSLNIESLPNNNQHLSQQKPAAIGDGIIQEDPNDEVVSDGEHDNEVQNFLQKGIVEMQRQGQNTREMNIPKRINAKDNNGSKLSPFKIDTVDDTKGVGAGKPKMKGNLGPMKKSTFMNNLQNDKQKEQWKKFGKEFDIDNVLPKFPENSNLNPSDMEIDAQSQGSFNLSIKNDDVESHFAHSHNIEGAGGTQAAFSNVPGLQIGGSNGDDSGLITSDSDFEKTATAAGYTGFEAKQMRQNSRDPSKRQMFDIKKDISKTFKRMLTSNHNRSNTVTMKTSQEVDPTIESTKYAGSNAKGDDDQMSELEKKFKKKKNKWQSNIQKMYKEDHDIEENYLEKNYPDNTQNPMLKTKKEDIRQLQEFVTTKRPKDPFKELEPLKQKVDISKGLQYQGTSQNEIFNARIQNHERNAQLKKHQFLMLPMQLQSTQDPDFVNHAPIRTEFEAYQQKVFYEIEDDSSEIHDSTSTDEDVLFAAEQPYMTVTNIAFRPMTKQVNIPDIMKRSDILITSTLSMSIFPKDKRQIQNMFFAQMKEQQIVEYIDEKNAFASLVKEHQYQAGVMRDKDKEFKDTYLKSFIHRSEFELNILQDFQKRVRTLNLNKKDPIKKNPEVVKAEKLKHEQNKRASEKRGLPKFDMDQARKLLDGKFHEDEDEEDLIIIRPQANMGKTIHANNEDDLDRQNRMEEIETAVHQIFLDDAGEHKHKKEDEIPTHIRKRYGLPDKMGIYEIDFNKLRNQDISFKKQKPLWSGQDVLRDRIDNAKSQWVITHINFIRVWPTGILGLYKRFRYYLRKLVKSALFDNLMTLGVLLNTIVLAMDRYGIDTEMQDQLAYFNEWFTWIFIFEMASKIVACGITKYTSDKMNYLDGGVVMLSIFEIVMEQVLKGGDGVNLSAFKTLRMLRTFRVFRIARLLKALESMQTIIAVISKSYMSFFYIAMLMFLFIIIFSLLGSEMFGGKIIQKNPDDPNTKPRGNFDTFAIALITVFQILTMENWQSVLFDSFYGQPAGMNLLNSLYCIVWIFLGNFILLNLFLAILLDSFLEEDGEEPDESEIAHQAQLKKERKHEKLKRQNVNRVFVGENNERKIKKRELLNQPSKLYFGQKPESDEDLEDLDEEYIIEIFKEANIIKQDQADIEKQKPYEDKYGNTLVFCDQSFYIFPKTHWFRLFCYKAINRKLWDDVVMVLIGLSSCKLGFDSYTLHLPKDGPVITYSDMADMTFNYLFIIEMCFKLVALGIIMDDGSYLRDTWNQLDFFIVMASVVDMALAKYDIGFVKIMRALRVLRPLRMIAHNPELKMIINALLDSVGSIMNVLIVIAVVYLIFAIIGVNLFSGKFYYCTLEPYKLHTSQECEMDSGTWARYDFNYDDVVSAMETLYVVSSLEGWPDIMYQTIDMTDYEKGPQREANQNAYWYYIIFIFIGSFFFLNFFIGVLFLKFDQAQKEDNKGFNAKDLAWQDIQKMILTAEPDYETTNVPKATQKIRRKFHDLVSSSAFEKVIMSCIVLNIFQMAMSQENLTPDVIMLLEVSGSVFSIIFLTECIFKLFAYGDTYFKNSWNQFDFVVVSSSVFDFLIKLLDSLEADLSVLSSLTKLARVFRILRVTRILKLADKDPGLQAIIQTIQFSIPSLANVGTLLMLIYFMFAIFGNFLFNTISEGDVIDPVYKNFRVFHTSILLVFALSTGEDWNKVMYDCTRTPHSPIPCVVGVNCSSGARHNFWFFYLIVFVCSHVMLNLFILVIIQQFDHYYLQGDTAIKQYKIDVVSFMKVWKKWTQDRYQCKKIKENQLVNFFKELGEFGSKEESLGFSEEYYDSGEAKKQLLKMGIKSNQGFVYFNELLYRCMRRKYGTMRINKKMQIIELKNQIRIYEMGRDMDNNKNKIITKEEIVQSIASKGNGFNPFLAVMNFKITVKTWIKHARKNVKKMERERRSAAGEVMPSSTTADAPLQQYTIRNDIAVEIEVQEVFSETSEEDESQFRLASQATLKLGGETVASRKGSNHDVLTSTKPKKQVDHLKLFKKKMTKKFSNVELQKSQKGSASLLASSKTLSGAKAQARAAVGQSERAPPRSRM